MFSTEKTLDCNYYLIREKCKNVASCRKVEGGLTQSFRELILMFLRLYVNMNLQLSQTWFLTILLLSLHTEYEIRQAQSLFYFTVHSNQCGEYASVVKKICKCCKN